MCVVKGVLAGSFSRVPSPRGGKFFLIFSVFFSAAFPGVVEAVALAVGLQDMDAVGQSVEQGPGHPFVAQDFGPLLEGQVAGEDEALAFVGATDDIEEQFGPGLGERYIAKLVEHEQVVVVHAAAQALELPLFTGLQQLAQNQPSMG